MTNFTVRTATIADHPAIRKHLTICWSQTYDGRLGTENIEALLKSLESDDLGGLLPQSDETAIISEVNNQIVGLAVGAVRQRSAYVWGCYVQKQYQRHGLGKTMFRTLLGALPEHEGVIVYVLDDSFEAQQFYQALGFKMGEATEFELVQNVPFPAHMHSVLVDDLKLD